MSSIFSGLNARLRKSSFKSSRSPAASLSGSPIVASRDRLASIDVIPPVPALPPLPASPSFARSMTAMASGDDVLDLYHLPKPLPLWLNPMCTKHIVKGNFMTLSARPKTVDQGEWIAHQVAEHYRNLWNFVQVVYEKEDNGSSICNATSCPRMSAGMNHSYTWLNARREPVEIPAPEYQAMMQQWISRKIVDDNLFPTDPSGVSFAPNPSLSSSSNNNNASLSSLSGSEDWVGKRSGFPKDFFSICQQIFLQMFRVYAHLYWAHYVDFYHLNLEKSLNSCFSHFVLTATALEMLAPQDIEPMQPLVDMWAANGTFPQESKAYGFANLQAGQQLLKLGGGVAAA